MNKKLSPLVTVIVPTYNREASIGACLDSLLKQTYKNIEIIISDDCSADETVRIVRKNANKSVRLLTSKLNHGPSIARNKAIKAAHGDIIFFTDDDVIVPEKWVENAMRYFNDKTVVGLEGKIIYVSVDYKHCYSDRTVENVIGNLYMTANMAYRRSAIMEVGLFDTTLRVFEDRDLALRIAPYGEIKFAQDFVVVHSQERYTAKSFFKEAKRSYIWLTYNELHHENTKLKGVFYEPIHLVALFLPVLILGKLSTRRLRTKQDWLILILTWPRLWYERALIWKWAYRNKRVII